MLERSTVPLCMSAVSQRPLVSQIRPDGLCVSSSGTEVITRGQTLVWEEAEDKNSRCTSDWLTTTSVNCVTVRNWCAM